MIRSFIKWLAFKIGVWKYARVVSNEIPPKVRERINRAISGDDI